MFLGVAFGLLACLLWGFDYLLPYLLPDYSTLYISIGRAIIMGLTSIGAIVLQAKFLSKVSIGDWWFASILTIIGNLIQPWFLFSSVLYAGVPLAATFFGLVPVCVAVVANYRDKAKGKPFLPFRKLAFPLILILLGLGFVNFEGLIESFRSDTSSGDFLIGTLYAIGSTIMWTWYPIKNADWLLEHPDVSSVFFAIMQSVILLPLGIAWYVVLCFVDPLPSGVLGPTPISFVGWMLFVGVFCSFVATALWNAMSQRVPTALVGPMLVFETIFSVVWGYLYDWSWPKVTMIIGMILFVLGVVLSIRMFESVTGSRS